VGLGPDRLYGGAGPDNLFDGLHRFTGVDRSADILMGGAGSDSILTLTGSKVKDLIRCGGGGSDQAYVDKGIDIVGEDCEGVYYRILS
jgi:Ca2+-binding RTX toxin-like protein